MFTDEALLMETLRALNIATRRLADGSIQAGTITLNKSGSRFVPTTEERNRTALYAIRKEYNLRLIGKVTKAMKGSVQPRVVTPKQIKVRMRV